jgi:RNA polymerase subunit RPABC4/transcription elongation factor Spt4
MDPDVGGGTDRDKIPSEDFAGRDRSFPIVTPADVNDAARSIGRAGGDNYAPDQLRSRITSIAHRKGDAFVAELPESWKKDMGNTEKAKKPPFEGAKPSFGGTDDDKPEVAEEAKPDTTKDDSETDDTSQGGATFSGESGLDSGGEDPDSMDNQSNKNDAVKCMKCEGAMGAGHSFCPNCGTAAKPKADKADARTCPKCDATVAAGHSFCPSCGSPVKREQGGFADAKKSKAKSAPHSTAVTEGLDGTAPANHSIDAPSKPGKNEPDLDPDVHDEDGKKKPKGAKKSRKAKAEKSSVGQVAGAVGAGASSTKPVPSHREPDGPYIEALEHDSGMATTPDTEMAVSKRFKSVGVPTDLGVIHDLTCPAYHPAVADKAHPLSGGLVASVDVQNWLSKANDATYGGTLAEAAHATQMWQHASTLKGAVPQTVAELRIEAHKSFQDANPGPTTFPRPTELSATQFKRPFLSSGHASASPGQSGPHTASIPGQSLTASQFTQGFQSAGRAADSPGNKNNDVIGYPSATGQIERVDYTEAQRNMVKSAMQAMHDHVEQTFPGVCPMAAPGQQGQAPEGARPVPTQKSVDKQNLAKKVAKGKMSMEEALELLKAVPEPVVTKAAAVDADLIKGAITEATSDLREAWASEVKKNSKLAKQLRKLQSTVESLGEMADPNIAAFRGVAQPSFKSRAAEPYAATVASTVEQTQLLMMRELETQARQSPDPVQREAAWSALTKMRGL